MQDRLAEVGTVLRRAEDRLASLMREALDERAYGEVAAIASISRGLHALVDEESGNLTAPEIEGSSGGRTSTEEAPPKKVPRGRRQKGAYPRFLRDGDRLVKVGWSKKDMAEYQHKAPMKAVYALVTALVGVGHEEFAMDALLPVLDEHGEEVPSYQTYLGLAWLRSWGAVRRESRGGYTVQPQQLLDSEVAARWQALPEGDVGGDQ